MVVAAFRFQHVGGGDKEAWWKRRRKRERRQWWSRVVGAVDKCVLLLILSDEGVLNAITISLF